MTIRDRIIEIAEKQSVFRANDIPETKNVRPTILRMVSKGDLIRVGRGLYSLPDVDYGENHTLAEATKRYPGSIICLISALFFHKIGTQLPYETWVMRNDKRVPAENEFPIRFVYCTDESFNFGIEEYQIEGTNVRIYSAAKTIADCFKYRNKIGLDVALEALREGWKDKKFTMDELWSAAKICRVQNVMQSYMEIVVQ
jgi:predicted transcriptional regulator of viral defense system